jgi:hypothetical protein
MKNSYTTQASVCEISPRLEEAFKNAHEHGVVLQVRVRVQVKVQVPSPSPSPRFEVEAQIYGHDQE